LTALAGVVIAILYNTIGNVFEAPGQAQRPEHDGPPMVAVLPFVSASLEGESEFFATGVHDDLLTQMAQLQSMRVISRTSVLEYKDTTRNIREIGEALGADAILEGRVQSAGDRIRINAQLIDARTDEHLWAQTYDRELSATNIFDVQAEIARAIASAMHATLTVQDTDQLAAIPTESMAAYRAYRRAMDILDAEGAWLVDEYRQALEEAVELDPTFTRAMAELAGNLSFANYFFEVDPQLTVRAEELLERILTLAPYSADYLMAQAYYTYYTLKDYDRAYEFISRAQNMRPSDVRILELKSWIQRRQGDVEGRLDTIRQARMLDPRDPGHTNSLVFNLMVSHRYDEAKEEIENAEFQTYDLEYWRNMLELKEHRDIARWANDLLAIQNDYESDAEPGEIWEAHIANRNFEAAEGLLSDISNEVRGSVNYLSDQKISQIINYWFLGDSDRLKDIADQARRGLDSSRDAEGNIPAISWNYFMALLAAVEGNTEESERLARRWLRGETDLASLALFRHTACQVLGMAGASGAAAECIRESLNEASLVFPFLEPFLPYYDSIRDEPAFIELLAEIESGASNPLQSETKL
jgi:TolB-like protein